MCHRTPFIMITVQTIRQNNELQCQPTVSEMQNILSDCFNKIIDVTLGIPCIENILFPEIQKKTFIFSVNRWEHDVCIFLCVKSICTISLFVK
jgi:dynein heavy chain